MAYEFRLPDIGEGLHEAEVLQWFVNIGEDIKADQPVVEVQTDKAAVEIASPVGGRVLTLGGQPGDTIKVGDVLISVNTAADVEADADAAEAHAENESAGTALAASGPSQRAVSAGSAPGSSLAANHSAVPNHAVAANHSAAADNPAAHPASATDGLPPHLATETGAGSISAGSTETPGRNKRVQAAPAVRKLAHDLGVKLHTVVPTGPNGRVLRADVQRAAHMQSETPPAAKAPIQEGTPASSQEPASRQAPVAGQSPASRQAPVAGQSPAPRQVPAASPSEGAHQATTHQSPADRREPIRGLRKRIYENMAKSMYTAPQATGMDDLNATRLVEVRGRLLPHAQARGIRLTYLPIIIKAVTYVLRELPLFNASVDDEAMEIVYKGAINIGIATATPEGLVVPVIHDADKKSVFQIAEELEDLTTRGRNRKLSLPEMTGSTFTITSTGAKGGWFATPIVNYPEVAILGVHTIEKRAVVLDDDSIVPQQRMSFSLTFDHRVIDGEPAGRFMHRLKEVLENPELMIAL